MHKKRVIFLGDCLFLDVGGFFLSPLLELGVAVDITYVTTRNLRQLRPELKALAESVFDMIFFPLHV